MANAADRAAKVIAFANIRLNHLAPGEARAPREKERNAIEALLFLLSLP
jgi:hypothetical protein